MLIQTSYAPRDGRRAETRAARRPPVDLPRVEFSDWHSLNGPTVAEAVNASEHREAFCEIVRAVWGKTNRFERVNVHWWHGSFIYIDVRDTRWQHYPCGHRFLVSFDLANGLLDSPASANRYSFARKGWGPFADRLTGGSVRRYKDCGQRDKKTYC